MKRTSSSAWSKGWIGWRDGLTRREVAAHPHPRKVRQLDKTASCYHQKQSNFIVSGEEIVVPFFRVGKGSKKSWYLPYRLGHNGIFPRLMCNVHQPRNVSRICFNVLRASVIQWSNIWCAPRYGSVLLRKVEERARSFAVASRPWVMNNWTEKLKPTPTVILVNNDYIRYTIKRPWPSIGEQN